MDAVTYALLMKEIDKVKQMIIKTGGVLDVKVNEITVVDKNGVAKISLPDFPEEIASKDDIDRLEEEIATVKTISFEVVDELPDEGQTGIIYLLKKVVKKGLFSKKNDYTEYVWLADLQAYEELGSMSIGDLENYVTKTYLESYHDSSKQDTITDLTDIRDGATLGKTALQSVPEEYAKKTDLPTIPTKISAFENDEGYLKSFTEEDPTVPSYVKAITEENITSWTNKSDFSGSYNDLTDKPTIPSIEGLATETYVNTEVAKKQDTIDEGHKLDYSLIDNTPTIPSLDGYATEEYVNNHHDSTKQDSINDLDTIKSGAALGATAVQPEEGKGLFSGNYNDLSNKPTIPDTTGMLTTTNYAATLDNVYQAKGDYVVVEAGKGLSTNDYTTADKTFVGELEEIITIDDDSIFNILTSSGREVKIGSYSDETGEGVYPCHTWLSFDTDGNGWCLEAKDMNETHKFDVCVTTNGTHGMTEDISYEFKQDGLYLNNSKVTFSGSYNDLTDKPTIPDVSNKLDKITSISTGAAVVYTALKSGDEVTQTSYQLTSNATGATAMFRDGQGRTKVATPLNESDAANKQYVDDHHDSTKQDAEIGKGLSTNDYAEADKTTVGLIQTKPTFDPSKQYVLSWTPNTANTDYELKWIELVMSELEDVDNKEYSRE